LSENDSYTRIFKSTGLFGGVQLFNMLLGIVRLKITALFLGPSGVGVLSLLTSMSSTIYTGTSLGIGSTSGVRSMASAVATGDERTIGRTISCVNIWGMLTGALGCGVTFLFAPLFSRLTFSSEAYTLHFRLLAVTILLMSITGTSLAVLQGARRLKALAAANSIISLASAAATIPLIVLFREQGIVPSIIAGALAATAVAWAFAIGARLPKATIGLRDAITTGVDMVKLGSVMTLSIFLGVVSFYVINAFVSHTGGPAEVGLYQAGVTLTTVYVGMIFTAMGSDYFPRLSQVNTDNPAAFKLIGEQAEIATIMITPLVAIFMVFLPIIIPLLYTSQFAAIIPMALWAAFATILKGVVWSLGFIFLAKGDYKVAFVVDNSINIVMVGSALALYRIFGLQGLGISTLIVYVLGLALTYAVARKKYGFSFSPQTLRLIGIFTLFGVLAFASAYCLHGWRSYVVGSVVAVLCGIFSYVEMSRRVDLKVMVSKIVGKVLRRSGSFPRLGPAKLT
jgi:O-antigen/teichoic acid export membrane protein